jgi:hypothetical protein
MSVKRAIWIPVVIGIVSATLIILAAEAQFFIPLGNNTSIGVGELFTTLSAALGGPIAASVTLLLVYGVISILHPELFPDMVSVFILLADAAAHLCAMLVVTVSYYKLIYPRVRKISIFLTGWFLTVGVYYYLALLPLSVILLNLADPDFGATYPTFAKNFVPEFLGTAVITTLILFALPANFRRPQWGKFNQELGRNSLPKAE